MTTADYLNQLEQDRQDLVDNLETQGITGLSGDETFTELVPEVLNIPAGADLSDYFTDTTSYGTSGSSGILKMIKTIPSNTTVGQYLTYAFANCTNLTSIPLLDTSNVSNMSYAFRNCTNLTSIPLLDTSNVSNMQEIFTNCSALTTIPVLNLSKVNSNLGLMNMFYGCTSLSNDSLNNILAMCTNATSWTGTKTLAYIGLTQTQAETCMTLSNYQDFLDAGWTTGY